MVKSLYTDTKVTVQLLAVADTADLTGAALDMKGYEGVMFVAGHNDGSVVTGWHAWAQQDTTNAFSAPVDLEGSDVSSASLTGIITRVLDIQRPRNRWVRACVTVPNTAATSVTVLTAIQYGNRILPETNTGGELHEAVAGTK